MDSKLVNTSASGERTFVLVFDPGDEAVQGLTDFARQEGIQAAAFTALGAFSRATFAWYNLETKAYEKIPVQEQVEVLSLLGNVSLKPDGTVQVHPHVVVGRRDGTAMGGHLMDGHVKPTLEVTLVEEPAHLKRKFNEEMGIALIDLGEG